MNTETIENSINQLREMGMITYKNSKILTILQSFEIEGDLEQTNFIQGFVMALILIINDLTLYKTFEEPATNLAGITLVKH